MPAVLPWLLPNNLRRVIYPKKRQYTFMNDEIRLDRETFKALAADTRVNILKSLSKRRMTGAELATEVSLSPSTIKEHLDQLEKARLIEQMDEGRKWKYYALTFKGRQITTSERPSMRVWIVLGLSILALTFTTLNIFFLGGTFAPQNELLSTGAADTFSAKSAYGTGAMDDAMAFNNPAPAAIDSCDATPNSCLSGDAPTFTAGVQEASPMMARSMYATGNDLPTEKQVSLIDYAIEATLLVLVLGLGFYAMRRKKRAAI